MANAQESSENKFQYQVIKWEKNAVLTQEEAEARLHQEGYESFCWYDVPGTSYPRHRHGYDECLWILRGEIQMTIQEQVYHLRSGDRIYLPAHTAHTAIVPVQQGVTYLVGQKVSKERSHGD